MIQIMVKGKRHSNLAAVLTTDKHSILSDLSTELGGNEEGPNPHQLIEAGLAGCTIMTCQMYANRKQWSLISTNVRVQIESESKETSKILREIFFEGDLTTEQVQRLLEIADKCPIHKLLQSSITIETKLAMIQV